MKKEYRVKRNEEFQKIIAKHHSHANGSFVLYVNKANEQHARVGISVSKKLGNAVVRNKIKRQIREMIKHVVDFESCDKDLIVIARMGYLNLSFWDNEKNLENLYKKVIIMKND